MNQNISLPKSLLIAMLVIGFMAVAASSFASNKPTAIDAQNFLKKMAENKMMSSLIDPLEDYVIVEPCKSTWKYDSSWSTHTASVDWANITSVKATRHIGRLSLQGAVIITKDDKQEISTGEILWFPDNATRDRAVRAIQIIIDECDVLGDAFGADFGAHED
ncbi:MAG: hypothetical protein COA60_003370 [Robiginitomaculum sp.]|nr:hypothetical protein [Robiginitomaculum sp.]